MPFKPISKKLREALARIAPTQHAKTEAQGFMRVTAQGDNAVDVMIYGNIGAGWWDEESISAKSVVDALKDFTGSAVNVRINSYGGSVSDGIAIHNELRRHAKRGAAINVTVDGVACSIASLIAVAGDSVTMPGNALMMLHAPWGSLHIDGNAKDIREVSEEFAGLLDVMGKAMAQSYARKSGLPASKYTDLWETGKDCWYSAEEAKAEGLCDVVDESLETEAVEAASQGGAEYIAALTQHAPPALRAAIRAAFRTSTHGENRMPDKNNPQPAKGSLGDESSGALAALRERNTQMLAMAGDYMDSNPDIRRYTISALGDPNVTLEQFGQRVLAELARGRGPLNGGGYVSTGSGSSEDFVAAAGDALAMRAGIKIAKPHPGARDVAGMGLQDILRACASRSGRGIDYGQNRGALVQAAMTTSDFPAILGNSLGKALRAGFDTEPATYEAWTSKVLVPDYRLQERPLLGSAPGLLPVPEGGEYQYGAMDEDRAVPYRVSRYGRILKFTHEAMINDDLGAFLRLTQSLGHAAARTEGDAIYGTFGENGGAGPTMQDGKALFHVDHANLASPAAAFDAEALGAARVLLRRQVAIGGGVLNLTPRFLLVSPEHEQAAETLLAAASRGLSQGTDNGLVPAWMAKLELVVEARLNDGAAYLLAGPGSVDTYERAWLESDGGPVIQEQESFNTDDRSYKVRHVFGGRWLDWRGAVKVPIS